MLLEGFANRLQQHDYDCLVICCEQILDGLGISRSEEWLWNQLAGSSGEVTVFTNVTKLSTALGIVVESHLGGTIEGFAQYIELGLPVIVAVDSDSSSHWPYYENHAVVVIGFDKKMVYINDPAQPQTGLPIPHLDFLHTWQRRDFQYAVLRLA